MRDNAFLRIYKKFIGVKTIAAPVDGKVIPAKDIKDPTFAEEMIGKTVGIIPSDGNVYAPFNGEVLLVFDTKHAIALKSEDGIELMIHFGLDTVKMGGSPFDVKVLVNQKVKKGDLLMTADINAIKEAGFNETVPVIISNSAFYNSIKICNASEIKAGETLVEITD